MAKEAESRRESERQRILEGKYGHQHPWLEEDPELERLVVTAVQGGGFDDLVLGSPTRREGLAAIHRAAVRRITELFGFHRVNQVVSLPFWAAWTEREQALGVKR